MTAGMLEGRIALITGASRGIGAAVAKRFAAAGAHVVLCARTVGGLEEVDDEIRRSTGRPAATLVPIDLRNGDEIDRLRPALAERFGRLDVLVGNAAILGRLSPLADIDPETWADVLAVNLNANFRLIAALDPLLRRSSAGRAMFVTSGVAHGVFPYWGPYAASKSALEMLVRVWAGETAKTALRINIVAPGIVRTRLRAEAMPGEDPMTLRPPEEVTGLFLELASPACTRHGEIVRPG